MKQLRRIFRICSHPADEFNEMQHAGEWPVMVASVILVLWFASVVMQEFATNFKFNRNNINELNVIYMFMSTIVLFCVICVINWALTTLLDGKGTLRMIYVSGAIALTPYIVVSFVCVALSWFITIDENMFMTLIRYVGLLWSAYLVISAQRNIHDYSFSKAVFCLFLTAVGMLFMLFLITLFFGLVQQLITFVRTVYVELRLRR